MNFIIWDLAIRLLFHQLTVWVVGDLLDEVTHLFPEDADTSDDEDEIKVAVIGKTECR